MATWYTPEEARDAWFDAPDDELLDELLEVARQAVLAYAPALPVPPDPEGEDGETPAEEVPVNYRTAQLMQARNVYNATLVDPAGVVGEDGTTFALRPHPLDWQIKQLLRPRRAIGIVR